MKKWQRSVKDCTLAELAVEHALTCYYLGTHSSGDDRSKYQASALKFFQSHDCDHFVAKLERDF